MRAFMINDEQLVVNLAKMINLVMNQHGVCQAAQSLITVIDVTLRDKKIDEAFEPYIEQLRKALKELKELSE